MRNLWIVVFYLCPTLQHHRDPQVDDHPHIQKVAKRPELAKQSGVSRDWIIELEKGKPNLSLTLVLRTLKALQLPVTIGANEETTPLAGQDSANAINLNDILDRHTNHPQHPDIRKPYRPTKPSLP